MALSIGSSVGMNLTEQETKIIAVNPLEEPIKGTRLEIGIESIKDYEDIEKKYRIPYDSQIKAITFVITNYTNFDMNYKASHLPVDIWSSEYGNIEGIGILGQDKDTYNLTENSEEQVNIPSGRTRTVTALYPVEKTATFIRGEYREYDMDSIAYVFEINLKE